jgi:hypothetical protein
MSDWLGWIETGIKNLQQSSWVLLWVFQRSVELHEYVITEMIIEVLSIALMTETVVLTVNTSIAIACDWLLAAILTVEELMRVDSSALCKRYLFEVKLRKDWLGLLRLLNCLWVIWELFLNDKHDMIWMLWYVLLWALLIKVNITDARPTLVSPSNDHLSLAERAADSLVHSRAWFRDDNAF